MGNWEQIQGDELHKETSRLQPESKAGTFLQWGDTVPPYLTLNALKSRNF